MATQKSSFIERLIQKILTGFGGLIDGIFGGGKKNRHPSTRDLVEKLKVLIDENLREDKKNGLIAPHHYTVRFESNDLAGTDSVFYNLRNELLAAAITYINDNRYKTLASPQIDIKADMFIKGIRLAVDFGESSFEMSEAQIKKRETQLDFKVPEAVLQVKNTPLTNEIELRALVKLPLSVREIKFNLLKGKRISVGRGKDNELFLDDVSVSKIHASLVFHAERGLLVADTGSTNGTFFNGERLAYGKALEVGRDETVKFGEIEVKFSWELPQVVVETPVFVEPAQLAPNAPQIMTDGEFSFSIKSRETKDFAANDFANEALPATENQTFAPQNPVVSAENQMLETRARVDNQSFETHFGNEEKNSAETLFGKPLGSEENKSFETKVNTPFPVAENQSFETKFNPPPKIAENFAPPPPPNQDFGFQSPKVPNVPAPLPSDTAQFDDELTNIKPRKSFDETQDFIPAPIPKD